MNRVYNLTELDIIAGDIIANATCKTLIFEGEVGTGKTTLIKAIGKKLGVTETMSSPTFSLVNEYFSPTLGTIFHFDFYRVNNPEEALDLGFEEYIHTGNWCFIEWANQIDPYGPEKFNTIKLHNVNHNERSLTMIF